MLVQAIHKISSSCQYCGLFIDGFLGNGKTPRSEHSLTVQCDERLPGAIYWKIHSLRKGTLTMQLKGTC
ncbi:hypothetical protein MKW92_051255 [Papaver armeniacum]|nr:hypothetical protein MKW92_051255 [Papaver armeniacum]